MGGGCGAKLDPRNFGGHGTIDRDEQAGKILVLRPPEPLGVSRTEKDPKELERVYQIGRREGLRRLGEIQMFLKTPDHI